MKRVRTTVASLMTAAALVVGSVALAAPAQALSQITGPASCSTEIRVASKTTGQTVHKTSAGQQWNKGVHHNDGATSYTGYKSLTWVQTDVTSASGAPAAIASSGFACK